MVSGLLMLFVAFADIVEQSYIWWQCACDGQRGDGLHLSLFWHQVSAVWGHWIGGRQTSLQVNVFPGFRTDWYEKYMLCVCIAVAVFFFNGRLSCMTQELVRIIPVDETYRASVLKIVNFPGHTAFKVKVDLDAMFGRCSTSS